MRVINIDDGYDHLDLLQAATSRNNASLNPKISFAAFA